MEQVSSRFISVTDEELILCLSRKVKGEEAQESDLAVMECDLYGDKEPWKIFNGTSEKDLYFFTRLKRKYGGLIRSAGCGRWHFHKRVKIYKDNLLIGFKAILRFNEHQPRPSFDRRRYIMHEFSLAGGDNLKGVCNGSNDYVLCRIMFTRIFKEKGTRVEKNLDWVVVEENEAQKRRPDFEEENQLRKTICCEVVKEEECDEQSYPQRVTTDVDIEMSCSEILEYYGLRNQIEDFLPQNIISELNII